MLFIALSVKREIPTFAKSIVLLFIIDVVPMDAEKLNALPLILDRILSLIMCCAPPLKDRASPRVSLILCFSKVWLPPPLILRAPDTLIRRELVIETNCPASRLTAIVR